MRAPLLASATTNADGYADVQLGLPQQEESELSGRGGYVVVHVTSPVTASGLPRRLGCRDFDGLVVVISLIAVGIVGSVTCAIVGSEMNSRPLMIASAVIITVTIAAGIVAARAFKI